MTYHHPSEYPMEHKYGDPYYCYVCGNVVGNRDAGENAGRGIFDISERVYHVVHFKCEHYYYAGHTWAGAKLPEEIHLITQRYYIDHYYHWDWLI